MNNIYIEYNPYKLFTIIRVNDKFLNNDLFYNKKINDFIDEIPSLILNELEEKNDLNITFFGLQQDFDDLKNIFSRYSDLKVKFTYEYAKDYNDKCHVIKDIKDILENSIVDNLYTYELDSSIKLALSNEFRANVISTMSSGKSTLLNALLRKKILPSKQEACTTIITEIKSVEQDVTVAKTYDDNGNELDFVQNLSIDKLDELNNSPEVSKVIIKTKIPFSTSKELELVLVDTPGPNNTNNLKHKKTTLDLIKNSSKSLVIYVLNATQLGINDDEELLSYISKSMSEAKNKDNRFFFVLNKLDLYDEKEDNIELAIENTRVYLRKKGIENPQIFPVSALSALNIMELADDFKVVGYSSEELALLDNSLAKTILNIQQTIKTKHYHLDEYTKLYPYIQNKIDAKKEEFKKDLTSTDLLIRSRAMKNLALIHSGIYGLEESINLFTLKYAMPAKIANVVDTFNQIVFDNKLKLNLTNKTNDLNNSLTTLQLKISENEKQIDVLKDLLTKKEDVLSVDLDKQLLEKFNTINESTNNKIDESVNRAKRKLERNEVDGLLTLYEENASMTINEFNRELSTEIMFILKQIIINVKNEIIKILPNYNINNIDDNFIINFKNHQNKFSIRNIDDLIELSIRKENVKVGEKEVENTSKAIYKPWTWFQKKTKIVPIYELQPYINGNELAKYYYEAVKEVIKEKDALHLYIKETKQLINDYLTNLFSDIDKELLIAIESLEINKRSYFRSLDELNIVTEKTNFLENLDKKVNSLFDL